MATATEIKTNILAYLARAGATDLLETTWFEFAHREIQRRHNFKCMESTANIATLVNGTATYTEPVVDIAAATIQVKEFGWTAHTWNNTTSKIVTFYQQTSYENILSLRANDNPTNLRPDIEPDTPYFAWYAGNIEIWPTPDATVAAYKFRMPCWKFITAPVTTATSWFSINAPDYLLYRSLLESVPYLSQPADRIKIWTDAKEFSFATVLGHDVSAAIAGPLRARG